MYRSVNSYYKWTLKVPFSGQLYIGLQTRVVAYMNNSGQASFEGQPYSGWIKPEVHRAFIIIHCRATRRAAMLKPQHLLWLPLTLHTAAVKSLSIIKMTPRNNTHLQLSGLNAQERTHIYIQVTLLCRGALKEFLFKDTQAADRIKPSAHFQGNLPDNWATTLLHTHTPSVNDPPKNGPIHSLSVALCVMSNEPNCSG